MSTVVKNEVNSDTVSATSFSILSVKQPTSGKALSLVETAIANCGELGLGSMVAGVKVATVASEVGRILAENDKGALSAKGGRVSASFDWSDVKSLTDGQRLAFNCAGACATAAAKLRKGLTK